MGGGLRCFRTPRKKAYDAANAQVEALEQQQIADLKSNMTVDQEVISQGMFGFMNYIIGGSQFTATQKKERPGMPYRR